MVWNIPNWLETSKNKIRRNHPWNGGEQRTSNSPAAVGFNVSLLRIIIINTNGSAKKPLNPGAAVSLSVPRRMAKRVCFGESKLGWVTNPPSSIPLKECDISWDYQTVVDYGVQEWDISIRSGIGSFLPSFLPLIRNLIWFRVQNGGARTVQYSPGYLLYYNGTLGWMEL